MEIFCGKIGPRTQEHYLGTAEFSKKIQEIISDNVPA